MIKSQFISSLLNLIYLIKQLYNLQSTKLKFLILIILFVSVLQFFAEIALAASLQNLLSIWGLLGAHNLSDGYFGGKSQGSILAIFIFLGTMKGILLWITTIVTGTYVISLEIKIKTLLSKIALLNRNISSGEIADLFNDKAVHSASFNGLILNLINRLVISIGLLGYLFYLSPKLTFIAIFSIILLAIPIILLNKKLVVTSNNLSKNISTALETLLSAVKNIVLIHIYGTSVKEHDKIIYNLTQYRNNYIIYFIISGAKSSIPIIFGVWFVAILTITSTITSSLNSFEIVAFFYLFLRFVGTISELSSLSSQITMTYPRARTIIEFLNANLITINTNNKSNSLINSKSVNESDLNSLDFIGIRLNNITFNYKNDFNVLDNLNLNIKPNSILLILGQSGVGKSTLLSIILGLEAPIIGEIFIHDNKNKVLLTKNNKQSYLELMGYVGPDNYIISGTIKSNLLYGIGEKSDGEIYHALKLAKCDFVYKLPGQLYHKLSEQGEGLSAGQKQRLSIARALLRKPKLLILDEATSNLDLVTEDSILKNLQSLKKEVTIIMVSHRKTIKEYADQIFYM